MKTGMDCLGRLAAGLVFAMGGFGCSTKPVTFKLEQGRIDLGAFPRVIFEQPVPELSDRQHWITVIPAEKPDSEQGLWQNLPAGSRDALLKAPTYFGTWEVRVYDPKRPEKALFRQPLEVSPGATGATPVFRLENSKIRADQRVKLFFEHPVAAPEGQKYWVAIVRPQDADEDQGVWKHIPHGTTDLEMDLLLTGGAYEVRLHDLYPSKPYGVLQREALEVVP